MNCSINSTLYDIQDNSRGGRSVEQNTLPCKYGCTWSDYTSSTTGEGKRRLELSLLISAFKSGLGTTSTAPGGSSAVACCLGN